MAGVERKSRAACVHMFLPAVDCARTNQGRNGVFSRVDSAPRANKIATVPPKKRRHILFGRADYRRGGLRAKAVTSHLMPTFARVHLAYERGEGVWLYATDGERYLDFTSGVAVNALGHAHPRLVEALKTQAEKLWHVSNIFRIPGQEELAARLCEATFADVVFFTNSGTEAVECALKMARRHHHAA